MTQRTKHRKRRLSLEEAKAMFARDADERMRAILRQFSQREQHRLKIMLEFIDLMPYYDIEEEELFCSELRFFLDLHPKQRGLPKHGPHAIRTCI